jgi:hypothetical protein
MITAEKVSLESRETAAPPIKHRGHAYAQRVIAFTIGAALCFNPYIARSESEGAPRLSDLIAVALTAVLLLRWTAGFRYRVRFPASFIVTTALLLLWIGREWVTARTLSSTDPIRWCLAIPYAYALHRFACTRRTRVPLMIGLTVGAAANVIVLAMQTFGLSEVAVQLGFASARWANIWITGGGEAALRPSGMWGHANATAGVIALGFPIVCGLVDEKRIRPWWIVAAWLVVFACSVFTFTRSGVIAAGIVFLVWTARALRSGRYVRWKLLLVAIGVAGVVFIGPPGGWWRWAGEPEVGENLGGRAETTLRAFDLALHNPLGLGAQYQERLGALTSSGIGATHNAWLYLSLVAGLPLAIWVLQGTIRRLTALVHFSVVETWLALALVTLSFFEEFFRVPVFPVIALWLLADPACRQFRLTESATPHNESA